MFAFLNDQKLVSLTPLLTAFIFEFANAGQLYEMWTKHSAKGQSIYSWSVITLALLLWLNFYRVKTPEEKLAIWMTAVAICMNFLVIGSVAYFKFIA